MGQKQYEAYPSKNRQDAIVWMAKNPHALIKFEELCNEAVAKGHTTFGMDFIREIFRWVTPIATQGSRFKFKNNNSPYITRFLFEKDPKWKRHITWCRVADELDGKGYIGITQAQIDDARVGL